MVILLFSLWVKGASAIKFWKGMSRKHCRSKDTKQLNMNKTTHYNVPIASPRK